MTTLPAMNRFLDYRANFYKHLAQNTPLWQYMVIRLSIFLVGVTIGAMALLTLTNILGITK